MTSVTSNPARFRRAPDVHGRAFGEELVVLDLAGGEYYSLDILGARIWNELVAGHTVGEVLALLVRDYDAEPELLGKDLESFAEELVRRGLLVPVPLD
jgi:Coenzyme PQQ synthesis protein D (PqqD)